MYYTMQGFSAFGFGASTVGLAILVGSSSGFGGLWIIIMGFGHLGLKGFPSGLLIGPV